MLFVGLLGGCHHREHNPVIFVHGCPPGPPICETPTGEPCSNADESHLFDKLKEYFRSEGYAESDLHTFVASGPACDSVLTQSQELGALVRKVQTSQDVEKVDIVAHSMGALTTRVFLLEGHANVNAFVSIGGGNHGSTVAAAGVEWQNEFGAPAFEGAKQMAPPYACEGQTSGGATDVQLSVNGCLTASGKSVERDETPGDVRYLSIWNSVDEIVSPRQAACLNQRFQNDCSDAVNVSVTVGAGPGPCGPQDCPGHVTMLWDPKVMLLTRNFVAR
jgi:triacylglycerol lipase